jgi:hypothetical protein
MTDATSITFEQAVHEAAQLLGQIEAKSLSDEEISNRVHALVRTVVGARGFFVTYLTDQSNTEDLHSDAVVAGLSRSAEIVHDLIAKNIVMSSAMALSHKRNNADELVPGSQRVTRRCMTLARAMSKGVLLVRLESMVAALEEVLASKDDGFDVELTLSKYSFGTSDAISAEFQREYETFLRQWRYDTGQLKYARDNLLTLLKDLKKERKT